ncbi:16S rRNA processing protein RimM [Desulfoplanes formicivorans]|uniref:Ribosome maturation factor RimM n=2 Tax=Desulfoplanes formicivorans TaxID=1592317 RepID=A0A194AKX7_9BACT|nr:16S rRNA processing protein RimM [Desulfoplanes formicivorans]
MDKITLVHIGKVLRPHGLKGELCIDIYADSPFLLDRVARIYLQQPGHKPKPFAVTAWQPHGRRIILRLDRFNGMRDEAARWTGADILMRARDLPPLEEGEYFCHQLVGCEVFLGSGDLLGRLDGVQSCSGREVWSIVTDGGREVLFPAENEFVRSVDVQANRIVIDPPPGLLDIYL